MCAQNILTFNTTTYVNESRLVTSTMHTSPPTTTLLTVSPNLFHIQNSRSSQLIWACAGTFQLEVGCWKCKWEWSLPSGRLWVHVDTYMLLSHLTHTSSTTEVSNSNLHRNYL